MGLRLQEVAPSNLKAVPLGVSCEAHKLLALSKQAAAQLTALTRPPQPPPPPPQPLQLPWLLARPPAVGKPLPTTIEAQMPPTVGGLKTTAVRAPHVAAGVALPAIGVRGGVGMTGNPAGLSNGSQVLSTWQLLERQLQLSSFLGQKQQHRPPPVSAVQSSWAYRPAMSQPVPAQRPEGLKSGLPPVPPSIPGRGLPSAASGACSQTGILEAQKGGSCTKTPVAQGGVTGLSALLTGLPPHPAKLGAESARVLTPPVVHLGQLQAPAPAPPVGSPQMRPSLFPVRSAGKCASY